MPLEILHRALVLLRLFSGSERSQITTLTCLGIFLLRIQPILARLQFSDHAILDASGKSRDVRNLVKPPYHEDSAYLILSHRKIPRRSITHSPSSVFAMLDSDRHSQAWTSPPSHSVTHLFSNICTQPSWNQTFTFQSRTPSLCSQTFGAGRGRG
jgi:hypothetical protein